MVKQDLAEFVSTIQQDTSTVVADTATAVKESLKVHVQHQFFGISTTRSKWKSNMQSMIYV